ncbi:MAG: metal-dependent hydrolase [Gemmatimonadaceae bacterium]
MYMGHLGIALGARAARPSLPLWSLVGAALLPDLANAVWNLTPIGDRNDLLSHSIPAVLVLGAVAWLLNGLARKDWQGGALLAALVLSHLIADYITSREAAWPGGPVIGAHLYLHHRWDLVVEGTVIVVGWVLYRRSLLATERRAWALYAMLAVLLGFQFYFTLLPIT